MYSGRARASRRARRQNRTARVRLPPRLPTRSTRLRFGTPRGRSPPRPRLRSPASLPRRFSPPRACFSSRGAGPFPFGSRVGATRVGSPSSRRFARTRRRRRRRATTRWTRGSPRVVPGPGGVCFATRATAPSRTCTGAAGRAASTSARSAAGTCARGGARWGGRGEGGRWPPPRRGSSGGSGGDAADEDKRRGRRRPSSAEEARGASRSVSASTRRRPPPRREFGGASERPTEETRAPDRKGVRRGRDPTSGGDPLLRVINTSETSNRLAGGEEVGLARTPRARLRAVRRALAARR